MGIEKIVKSEPIYEDVRTQTGTREKEMWVTSDGKEYYSLSQAETHEFWLQINLQPISLALECDAINLRSQKDYEEYKNRCHHYGDLIGYDEKSLIFPNTFVSYWYYSPIEDDDSEIVTRQLVPLSEYKKMINEKLDSLQKIEQKGDVENEGR